MQAAAVATRRDPGPAAVSIDRHDGPRGTTDPWYQRRWFGFLLAGSLTALAAVVFGIGITRPWPWSDEGASYLALQRDWPELLVLYRGPDAPIVPYYLVGKAWVEGVQLLWPQVSTLIALRLLSAAAATATVTLLYALVARNAGRFAGMLAGLLLISLPGFSRYAQEARTYALLALAATAGWLLWDRWLRPHQRALLGRAVSVAPSGSPAARGYGRAAGYAVALTAVGLIHTFGLFQWPAHVLATLTAAGRDPWPRRRRMAALAVILAVAAGLVAMQTLASLSHGTGPLGAHRERTVGLLPTVALVLRTVSVTPSPGVSAAILVLAGLGVVAVRRPEHRVLVTSLIVWLVVPLALGVAVGSVRTNLFRQRYLIAALPPFAALAGLGLAQLGLFARSIAVRRLSRARVPGRATRWVGLCCVVAVSLLGLVLQAALTLPTHAGIRTARGHGQDLSGVLAEIDAARMRYGDLPVLLSGHVAPGVFGAVDPDLQRRNPLRQLDPSRATVYAVPTTPAVVRRRLGHAPAVLWVVPGAVSASEARGSMPRGLVTPRYQVVWAHSPTAKWTVLLLTDPGTG